jgi:hypothetical protein
MRFVPVHHIEDGLRGVAAENLLDQLDSRGGAATPRASSQHHGHAGVHSGKRQAAEAETCEFVACQQPVQSSKGRNNDIGERNRPFDLRHLLVGESAVVEAQMDVMRYFAKSRCLLVWKEQAQVDGIHSFERSSSKTRVGTKGGVDDAIKGGEKRRGLLAIESRHQYAGSHTVNQGDEWLSLVQAGGHDDHLGSGLDKLELVCAITGKVQRRGTIFEKKNRYFCIYDKKQQQTVEIKSRKKRVRVGFKDKSQLTQAQRRARRIEDPRGQRAHRGERKALPSARPECTAQVACPAIRPLKREKEI